MFLLPKELLIEGNVLYENDFNNININELSDETINKYNILQKKY
jgi:hypothetical protein